MMLTALALVPGGAHLFALPNKIHLAAVDYFIVQTIYRNWALFGVVLIAAILANVALAIVLRGQGARFAFTAINAVCLLATLAIFFAYTFPANQVTNNWTEVPANWEQLRRQWEFSHAVNACITFAGFCSLTISLLVSER